MRRAPESKNAPAVRRVFFFPGHRALCMLGGRDTSMRHFSDWTTEVAVMTGDRLCKRLILALGLLLAASGGPWEIPGSAQEPGQGKKYALLVGVDKYEKGSLLPGLPFPRRDVEELAKVFLQAGYDKDNVVIMTKERGLEDFDLMPTAEHIRNQFQLLLAQLKPGDSIIVALAGHGVLMLVPADKPEDKPRAKSFFCPMDANLARKQLPRFIDFDELYKGLADSPATVKLLLVDACRNNPTEGNRGGIPFAPPPVPASVAALFSCSDGEVAWDDADLGGGHGVFFHYVIEGLKGAADQENGNRDNKVSLAELTAFTQDKVLDFVSHRRGRRQMPTLQGRAGLVTLLDVPRGLSAGTITNSLGMNFTLIKAGEFLMGSPDTDKDASDVYGEKPRHRVRITRPFYLGVHEVTRGQFRRFVEETGYQTDAEKDGKGGWGWDEQAKKFEQN